MNRFRELRINNNYSLTQLANKIKVHQTAISQWELGKSFPDILTMQKLADLYGVSIDYILGRETSRNGQATLSEDEKKLLRNYRGLGAEENTVQEFIENKKQKPRMYEKSASASGGGSVTQQLTEEEVEAIRKILNQIDQG